MVNAEIEMDIKQGLDKTTIESPYDFRFRASSLPFCPRQYVLHNCLPTKASKPRTAFGDLCMDQGTALHTVVQRYLGLVPGLLYGDWDCPLCSGVTERQYGPQYCSTCGTLMVYREFTIGGGPIGGHPDGILLKHRGLLEIKGTGFQKLNKLEGPVWYHYLQANFYAHEMNLRNPDWQLDKIVFLYIDRGMPSHRKVFCSSLNPTVYRNCLQSVTDSIQALERRELPARMCPTPKDGESLYCAYVPVCFLPDEHLLVHIRRKEPGDENGALT